MDVHCSSQSEGSGSGKQDAESALTLTSGHISDQLAGVRTKCGGLRPDCGIGWSGNDAGGEREPDLPSWGPPLQQGPSAAQKCELRRQCWQAFSSSPHRATLTPAPSNFVLGKVPDAETKFEAHNNDGQL